MSVDVFKPLAELITTSLTGWVGISDAFIAGLRAPLVAGLALMIVWRGLSIVRGVHANMALLDTVLATLRVTLVWYGALTAGSYSSNVIGFFLALRTSLAEAFTPGAVSGYAALDVMLGSGVDAYKEIWNRSSEHMSPLTGDFTGFLSAGGGAVMLGCLVIFGIVAAINLLFVDLALMFLVAVGPLFVAAFAFPQTARFTDAWIGSSLKYIFSGTMVTAVASMGIAVMKNYAADLAAVVDVWDFVAATFACLGASGVLIMFAARAPAIASDITSGIAVHALGMTSAAGPLGAINQAFGKAAKGVTNSAAYAAGSISATPAGQSVAASAPGTFIAGMAGAYASASSVMSGSARAAYDAGRGGEITSGSATASAGRPLSTPAGSRSLPPVSYRTERAADELRLAA